MTRAPNLPAARNLDLPLSRFPLRGHRRLRCGSGTAPAQSTTLIRVLGR